jgi:hypothetical protein
MASSTHARSFSFKALVETSDQPEGFLYFVPRDQTYYRPGNLKHGISAHPDRGEEARKKSSSLLSFPWGFP